MRASLTTTRNNWTSALLASLIIALAVASAPAGCTNYESYLHWTGMLPVTGGIASLSVYGAYEYLVGDHVTGSWLKVADVSNVSVPVLVDTVAIPGTAQDVAVEGTVAVVACSADTGCGLYVVDISDPSSPQIVGSALPGAEAVLVALRDSLAYVVRDDAPACSLHVVDVSDRESPTVRSSTPIPYYPSRVILLGGDYAYIAGTKLYTVNVADPDSVFLSDTDEITGEALYDIAVSGDYLIGIAGHPGPPMQLVSFSLADPGDPEFASSVNTGVSAFLATPNIAVSDGICYATVYSADPLIMFDVSDPLNMGYYGLRSLTAVNVENMAIFGNSLHIWGTLFGPHGMVITVSISSPDPLVPISGVDTPGDALGVVVPEGRDDVAYVADGEEGVQIVDISDPLNPVIVDRVDTPGYASDIVLVGTIAYVADRESGLQVIDTTVPGIIGSVDTPGMAVDLAVGDTVVYMADSSEGLRIIDISIPSLPTLRGAETAIQDARGVDVSADGRVAYVADHGEGLQAVDVSDPDNPWIIDGVRERAVANASKVDVDGDRAYVTDDSLGLVIVDVLDPYNLSTLSIVETEDLPGDVDVLGRFAFVGSGAGMNVIDIEQGTSPEVVGGLEIPSDARGIYAGEFYAYVAAGSQGLQICPTQCGFDGSVLANFSLAPPQGLIPLEVAFTNESEGYGLSYQWDFGDGVGTSTETDPGYTYTAVGIYTVVLEATNGTNTARDSLWVLTMDEPATIQYVEDEPDDQGGYARVRFCRSYYDVTPATGTECYVVQRQDGRVWAGVDTLEASGQYYYTRVVPTSGNGAGHESEFRIVANMDEGSWTSSPVAGYSLDNIAPQTPENLAWLSWGHLDWDDVPDDDFEFYRVHGSPTPDFGDAVAVDTTWVSESAVDPAQYPCFFVTAVDTNGLESDPSAAPDLTGLQGPVIDVELMQAMPSPFNPSTVIGYAVPAEGHVRLRVYDVGGRLVRVLVDDVEGPGRHRAVWTGRDDAGNRVASGVYFYRLDACGKTLRKTMTLLK